MQADPRITKRPVYAASSLAHPSEVVKKAQRHPRHPLAPPASATGASAATAATGASAPVPMFVARVATLANTTHAC